MNHYTNNSYDAHEPTDVTVPNFKIDTPENGVLFQAEIKGKIVIQKIPFKHLYAVQQKVLVYKAQKLHEVFNL